MSQQILTDEHFQELDDKGFVIIPGYLPKPQHDEMAAAIRRVLKPWDQLKDNPPAKRTDYRLFPYEEPSLNEGILNRDCIAFAKKWLGTDHIHYRPGLSLVRYPGFTTRQPDTHIDNGNNSLLPPKPGDRGHAQIVFWFYLEDVDHDQAPTYFIANEHGDDITKAVPMVGPGGTLAIFHNYTWHGATSYERAEGQRYIWKFAFGRADHYWEGVTNYTNVGDNPHFQKFIGQLTAEDRMLFRFPPPGDPYYTAQTLEALEARYPGWNARNEYAPHV